MQTVSTLPSTSVLRRLGRLVSLVSIALAAGHLAQTLALRQAIAPTVPAGTAPINIVQLSAAPEDAYPSIQPEAAAPRPGLTAGCAPRMTLAAEPGAMVLVHLLAPCDGAARVVLHHAGLSVTERVQPDGSVTVRLPAMEQNAEVKINFADGRAVMATLDMPEMAGLKRFAVQWLGVDGFVLRGIEQGPQSGRKVDVSPSQPGIIPHGGKGSGWLSQLGNAAVAAPLLAQVYTYPTDGSTATIVVEAPVTAQTCGQDLLAQTLSSGEGAPLVSDLTLPMPECSAVGDVLVLNNLAQDTKLAAR